MTRTILLLVAAVVLGSLVAFVSYLGPNQLALNSVNIETRDDQLPGVSADIMDQISAYIGRWNSEVRTTADGRTYQFEYILETFDRAGKTLSLTILQHFEDGESRLLWEGFKGWDAVAEQPFYYGFSPDGRMSRGTVYQDEAGALVTEYEGIGPTGNSVMIRDVFESLDADHFKAITYMLREGEWQIVWQDDWTRAV